MKYVNTLLFVGSFCLTLSAQFNVSISLVSGGVNRSAIFRSPSGNANNVPANLPLVIVLHGDGGSGSGIKNYSGFDAVAEANHFIAIYPDAINSSWNRYADDVVGDAGLNNPNAPDDVLFIKDLIDYMCANYAIDNSKVYVTGHSAGGFLAYNLAIQAYDKIAAFAPVAGSLWGDNAFITNFFTTAPSRPPILHIHGDNDNTVSYPDSNHQPDSYGEWPLNGFSVLNCGLDTYQSTTPVVANVTRLNFCSAGNKVELIRIHGGGHEWPNVANFNAAQTIWDFFSHFQIASETTCGELEINEWNNPIIVKPNPMVDELTVESNGQQIKSLTLVSISGELVATSNTNRMDVSTLTSGFYFLSVTIEGKGTHTVKVLK